MGFFEWWFDSDRFVLSVQSTAFSGGLQLAVSLGMDGISSSGEHIVRRDVTQGTMQTFGVVMLDELSHDSVGVIFR